MIPTLFAHCVVPVTDVQLHCLLGYKVFLEVAGHSGLHWRGSCFPQLMALPAALGMEIRTEDHDMHHSRLTCNYSKRFTLWDRLFGTYLGANAH